MTVSPDGSGAVDAPAVAMRSLTKRFGDKTAVDHVDLDIARGSFFGLVGPNGAGKSTTMKMCTGLLRPDEGGVRLLGKGELKAKVAFEVYHATAGAIAAVEKAGGSVKLLKPAEKAADAK